MILTCLFATLVAYTGAVSVPVQSNAASEPQRQEKGYSMLQVKQQSDVIRTMQSQGKTKKKYGEGTAAEFEMIDDQEPDPTMHAKVKRMALAAKRLAQLEGEHGGEIMEDAVNVLHHAKEAAAGEDHELTADLRAVEREVTLDQTPEIAERNQLLITAHDVAQSTPGNVMAEDEGTNGHLKSFQGDMVPVDDEQMSLFQDLTATSSAKSNTFEKRQFAGSLWSNGEVHYCFASDVPAVVKMHFQVAVKQYRKALPCLNFVDVGWNTGASADSVQMCNKSPAVFVSSRSDEGCYTYVGMTRLRAQRMNLAVPGCSAVGTIMHELGHAIGMAHEQSRPDRGKYVHIIESNIQPSALHNFDVSPGAYTGIPYDFLSLMHYDAFGFAIDPQKPTIESLVGHKVMGQRVGLSKADIRQLVAMYKSQNQSCTANVLQEQRTRCISLTGDNGEDLCSGIYSCGETIAGFPSSVNPMDRCCACGGGVHVQCYEGESCVDDAALAPGLAKRCIMDMTAILKQPPNMCWFRNTCAQTLKFKCPNMPCTHSSPGGGKIISVSCNGQREMEICKNTAACVEWDPNVPATRRATTTNTRYHMTTSGQTASERRRRRISRRRIRRRRTVRQSQRGKGKAR